MPSYAHQVVIRRYENIQRLERSETCTEGAGKKALTKVNGHEPTKPNLRAGKVRFTPSSSLRQLYNIRRLYEGPSEAETRWSGLAPGTRQRVAEQGGTDEFGLPVPFKPCHEHENILIA
jgi:hypothetical protein